MPDIDEEAVMKDVFRDDESDMEYAARRGRELHAGIVEGTDAWDEAFSRLERATFSRNANVIISPGGGGLGAAMAVAAGLGGSARDRSADRFIPMPRNIPRGAVKVAPGVWARDPKNKPKRKHKGSKAAKKASRRR